LGSENDFIDFKNIYYEKEYTEMAYPKEYREIIWFYTDWLEKNRSSLVFNEKTGVFAIKK
ncbi:MAG: hypothetical protein PHD82_15360, partial [Candidatus Riflebacteria bacterium]|nr:hypothetical protein [Candidatus Riflebacteria bacterium]